MKEPNINIEMRTFSTACLVGPFPSILAQLCQIDRTMQRNIDEAYSLACGYNVIAASDCRTRTCRLREQLDT